MDHLKLTKDKLSVEEISELVVDDSCGAVSLFVGTTRNNFQGKKVLRLEYEAYESMALKAMKGICDEIRLKWPAIYSIAIYHRLGSVPCREASVVIAASSPHRGDSLAAVAHCIDRVKGSVPIWKKEVYDGAAPVWKENVECRPESPERISGPSVDRNLVQINVSNEEIQKRIRNFIERKREQVNVSNIQDFIPNKADSPEDEDSCARVRTQFIRRSDSKGHLKIHKVQNEWGPCTVSPALPPSIAERVNAAEEWAGCAGGMGGGGSVPRDVFARLKRLEDAITELQAVSPEYAHFWKQKACRDKADVTESPLTDYKYSADDIARKIELIEAQEAMEA